MYNYYERTYYTLDDIRKEIPQFSSTSGPYAMSTTTMSNFFYYCMNLAGLTQYDKFNDTNEGKICFEEYIWPRFYQEAIVYVDFDENEDFVKKFAETKISKIFAWWISSTDKYSLLIQNLEANKTKLLDDVKSASVSRFNDTPQNSGDFSDDQHTSTITKTENSTNVGTMMARLNEIEDNIKQLYIDWSNEFRKFIIWSVN